MPQVIVNPAYRRVLVEVGVGLLWPFGVGAHPLTSADRGEASVPIATGEFGR